MPKGLPSALLAYLAWGFLPLYWKALGALPAWEILGHRVVWSTVFLAIVLLATRKVKSWRAAMKDGATFRLVLGCSLLISCNWLVFIWAVNNGHMVESSLGYYMNPLLNVLLGVLFLKERPLVGQWVAIGLAFVGLAIVTVEVGRLPWISLVLAGSFAVYGLLKKKTKMESTVGLAWETLLVTPAALGYLLYLQGSGGSAAWTLSIGEWALLLLAGAATVLPLFWFAQAAKHLSLSTIGFIQYIGPSIMLVLGVLVYREPFEISKWISFGFIWLALIVYTVSSYRGALRAQRITGARAA